MENSARLRGLMPDSYQLQNCSSRNMMKTCGMKIIIF